MERLSDDLRKLVSLCAAVVEEKCLPPAIDAADAENRSAGLFPNDVLDDLVEKLVETEKVDVPVLLANRQPGEERRENPEEARVDASLLSVLKFDIGSLVARRNGLGPAHDRNNLRDRVPAMIHCADCTEHMRRGLKIIFANALLRTTPDFRVRTRLVVTPRELDQIVAGSAKRPQLPASVLPDYVPMPDVEFEMAAVTRAREEYPFLPIRTHVPLDSTSVRSSPHRLPRRTGGTNTSTSKRHAVCRLESDFGTATLTNGPPGRTGDGWDPDPAF